MDIGSARFESGPHWRSWRAGFGYRGVGRGGKPHERCAAIAASRHRGDSRPGRPAARRTGVVWSAAARRASRQPCGGVVQLQLQLQRRLDPVPSPPRRASPAPPAGWPSGRSAGCRPMAARQRGRPANRRRVLAACGLRPSPLLGAAAAASRAPPRASPPGYAGLSALPTGLRSAPRYAAAAAPRHATALGTAPQALARPAPGKASLYLAKPPSRRPAQQASQAGPAPRRETKSRERTVGLGSAPGGSGHPVPAQPAPPARQRVSASVQCQ